MGGAARAIGNEDLETKFDDAIKLLERPNTVVFNPSYVDARWPVFLAKHTSFFFPGCISKRVLQSYFHCFLGWLYRCGQACKYRCPASL